MSYELGIKNINYSLYLLSSHAQCPMPNSAY